MKEFPKDLYDVTKNFTVISNVKNSGNFPHMYSSHRRTLCKNFLFFISFFEGRKLNVYMLIII